MAVNVRWVTVNGQRQLLVTTTEAVFFTLPPDTAWELITELRCALMADAPRKPGD